MCVAQVAGWRAATRDRYGPCMTVCNRYDRWAKAGGGILERFPIAERVQQQLQGLQ